MANPELADRVHDWFTEECDANEHIAAIADFEEAVHIELLSPLDLDCMIDALHGAGYETRQQTIDDTFTVEALRVRPTTDGPERQPVGVQYTATSEVVLPHSYIDSDSLGNTETFQHLCLYFEHQTVEE